MIRPPYNVMMLPQNNDRGEPAVDEAGDLWSMTLRRQSQTSTRTAHNPGNIADHDLGLCSPAYRGWRLHCLAAETPAGRVGVLMEEQAQRFEPRSWPPAPDASRASATGPGPAASPKVDTMKSSAPLVRYDAMCAAIAKAYRVDEVKSIRDKHLAIAAYARQANGRTRSSSYPCQSRAKSRTASERTGEA